MITFLSFFEFLSSIFSRNRRNDNISIEKNEKINSLRSSTSETTSIPFPPPISIPLNTIPSIPVTNPPPPNTTTTAPSFLSFPSSPSSSSSPSGFGKNISSRTPPTRPGRMPVVNINSQKESIKRDEW